MTDQLQQYYLLMNIKNYPEALGLRTFKGGLILKLKEMRQAKGFSQSQLAEKTGINVRTLQHYEQGSKIFDHARIDTLLKCCAALDCQLEDIIENPEYVDLIKKVIKN